MAKRFLLALLALVGFAQVAAAQSFPQPPDTTYVPSTITYQAGTTPNVTVDTEVSGLGLADIPATNRTSWMNTGTFDGGSSYKAIPPGSEKKFRTHANFTHFAPDDPVRNYCQPGGAHLHLFFGNPTVNACSTFAKLRAEGKYARAGGGNNNRTGYWVPAPIIDDAFGDGRSYMVKPNLVTIYYQEPPRFATIRHVLGQRYVGGFHMDYGDAWLQGKLDIANAQPGTAGRYQLSNGSVKGAWHKWVCASTSQKVDYLATSTGADPFSPTCPSSSVIYLEFQGPRCWNRTSTWSPGGYEHVIPEVWDNVAGDWVCPIGWSRTGSLQLKLEFTHEGATGARGYTKWRLSSDPIAAGQNSGTINGQTVLRGQTFHADWFGAWDGTTFNSWQDNCLGANGATPHECDSGVINATQQLKTNEAGPEGPTPVVDMGLTFGTSLRSKMVPVTTPHTSGSHTVHVVTNKNRLTAQGDSIQLNASGGPAQYAVNNGEVTVVNRAQGGAFLSNVTAQLATVIADNPKVVTIGIGTNDLPTGDLTAWLATYDAHAASLRAAGIRVVPILIIPKVHPTNQAGFNTARATVNTHLKAGVGTKFDAVIDYSSSTCFDADADAASTTCYNVDGIHPNGTGYAAMVPIYDAVVDALLGR
jgi:lysophospholipase L1-like esterase